MKVKFTTELGHWKAIKYSITLQNCTMSKKLPSPFPAKRNTLPPSQHF